jgi:hypothetical protein
MEPFFRYYYYNEGLNTFDTDVVKKLGDALFNQWKSPSDDEQLTLRAKSQHGYNRSCIMLAHEAFLKGNTAKAHELYNEVISREPQLIIHYWSLYYYICRVIGEKGAISINKGLKWLVHLYRGRRYLYRYSRK